MSRGGAGNTNNRKGRHKHFGGVKWAQQTWEIQRFKQNNIIIFIMVNTGNVGVSWGGMFENRQQQKGFQNVHFLSMKTRYCQVSLFSFWLLFHTCQDVLEINNNFSNKY